jgi:hypothetical protein
MGTGSAVADVVRDDRDYVVWLRTIAKASARLEVLQTAVTELRYLCESDDVHREQVLEVLETVDA